MAITLQRRYGKAWKAEDPSLKDPPPYPYTQKMATWAEHVGTGGEVR